jgi:hypothetical protein
MKQTAVTEGRGWRQWPTWKRQNKRKGEGKEMGCTVRVNGLAI